MRPLAPEFRRGQGLHAPHAVDENRRLIQPAGRIVRRHPRALFRHRPLHPCALLGANAALLPGFPQGTRTHHPLRLPFREGFSLRLGRLLRPGGRLLLPNPGNLQLLFPGRADPPRRRTDGGILPLLPPGRFRPAYSGLGLFPAAFQRRHFQFLCLTSQPRGAAHLRLFPGGAGRRHPANLGALNSSIFQTVLIFSFHLLNPLPGFHTTVFSACLHHTTIFGVIQAFPRVFTTLLLVKKAEGTPRPAGNTDIFPGRIAR